MIGLRHPVPWRHALAVSAIGTAYWTLIVWTEGVSEPWDAALYWTVHYPVLLLISAVTGALVGRRHCLTGFGLNLPQALVMLPSLSDTALAPVGFGYAGALSIPAVIAAWLAARIVTRR